MSALLRLLLAGFFTFIVEIVMLEALAVRPDRIREHCRMGTAQGFDTPHEAIKILIEAAAAKEDRKCSDRLKSYRHRELKKTNLETATKYPMESQVVRFFMRCADAKACDRLEIEDMFVVKDPSTGTSILRSVFHSFTVAPVAAIVVDDDDED